MEEILGKLINFIYMSEDKKYIVFIFGPDDYWIYLAEDDCCNPCWFESINNVEALIGAHVLEVIKKEDIEIKGADDDSDGNISMGYTLKTTKGYVDIEYRCEVSPYYRGSCNYVKDLRVCGMRMHPEKISCVELGSLCYEIFQEDLKNKRNIYLIDESLSRHGNYDVIKLKSLNS